TLSAAHLELKGQFDSADHTLIFKSADLPEAVRDHPECLGRWLRDGNLKALRAALDGPPRDVTLTLPQAVTVGTEPVLEALRQGRTADAALKLATDPAARETLQAALGEGLRAADALLAQGRPTAAVEALDKLPDLFAREPAVLCRKGLAKLDQ